VSLQTWWKLWRHVRQLVVKSRFYWKEWLNSDTFIYLRARAFRFSSSALPTSVLWPVPWPKRSKRAFFLASISSEAGDGRPNLKINGSLCQFTFGGVEYKELHHGNYVYHTPLSPRFLLLLLHLFIWRYSPKPCKTRKSKAASFGIWNISWAQQIDRNRNHRDDREYMKWLRMETLRSVFLFRLPIVK
jgi:hypothetical protein